MIDYNADIQSRINRARRYRIPLIFGLLVLVMTTFSLKLLSTEEDSGVIEIAVSSDEVEFTIVKTKAEILAYILSISGAFAGLSFIAISSKSCHEYKFLSLVQMKQSEPNREKKGVERLK